MKISNRLAIALAPLLLLAACETTGHEPRHYDLEHGQQIIIRCEKEEYKSIFDEE